jgi:uncharacterized membrane protein
MNLLVRRRVLWDYLAGALWVLPTISVLVFLAAGALLSRLSISNDSPLAALAFQGTADDARNVLIVVSTTMITVTGLVFALTIVALQIASGQYSPRLLRNFMRDRGTQVVLSVFVGAFAYSTAGLYTVGIQHAGEQAFVPRLAVSGSLGLALVSVGVLIYFIHHLAHSIQIDAIMSQIQRETSEVIDDVYPHAATNLEPEERCPDPPAQAVVLSAVSSGYIQAIQPVPLVETATRHDLVVRLARRVGDHVVAGTPIAWAWPRFPDQPLLTPALLAEAVADAVQVGFERTMVQDVLFGLRRLVDIANRALSPAVNDPYTAIQAVHHLSVLLCVLVRRRLGDWLCRDRQGTLRVAVPFPDFDEYLRRSTAQIRRFGAAEPPLTRSLIELLRDVGTSTASQERRAACTHHLWLVLEDAKRETAQPDDLQAVLEDGAAALSALGAEHPPDNQRLSTLLTEGVRDARSGGDPAQPAAKAHQCASGPEDSPDPVQ